ncbi:Phosphatidylinositol 5-phosphate 4-kinase type-2 alpha [Linnemannia zychae]|nr:Phosphatidylinositol 5-phosphate 4-kinase type-2 alpha [Linnemannia zychae]
MMTSIPDGFVPTLSTAPRSQIGSRMKPSPATATVTTHIPETPTVTTMGIDSIPMDAESRWRDHHMKRQWAQSLLIESMEPVLSRHLRHAIKSVLHFTNAGPEIMDLKGSSSGLGHWDSFATPTVFPPKVFVPHALSNSVQINHQASTPITATPTQAVYQQLPAVSSSHAPRTDHIRIPSVQQRARSASINSLTQLLEAQRAGEAHSSKEPSTSSTTRGSDMATSVPLTHRTRNPSVSSVVSPTIVVRGFTSSTTSTRIPTITSEEVKSKSTMMIEADDISEIDLGPSEGQLQHISGSSLLGAAVIATVATIPTTAIDSTDNLATTLQSSNNHSVESNLSEGAQNHIEDFNNDGDSVNDNNGGFGIDSSTDQSLVPSKPRHSRLWSKMRKVVYGESKQQVGQSRNTIYLATGGGTGATNRSMSDTHLSTLPSRPATTSATTSYNSIIMPSFSSGALSVLSEDQMPFQKDLPKTPTLPKASVGAFETPPETAPNSPTQALTPTSPTTRSRFRFSHNLPGLARRSSTKSPVAAAELTTAESRVSQFMYAGQTSHSESNTSSSSRSRVQSASSSSGVSSNTIDNMGPGMPLMDLSLLNDHFSTPNALERSNFKSALKTSADIPDSDSIPKQLSPNNQLGRSKSASSAQRSETRHKTKSPTQAMAMGSGQNESFHDGEQFLTAHRRFREFGILSPPRESVLKDGIPLDTTRKKDNESGVVAPSSPPPPTVAWSANTRHTKASSPHQQQTSALSPDGRPLSPSQMLSGTSDLPPEQSKQDRRKSAISFGGYFSNPSAGNRRTRDLTGHSISGLGTDAQGEIIHLRRTSFFEKASSPPTLASLATILHSNLPSLPQSLGGTYSPSLSRSPSKSSGLAQEQRTQLQGRPSIAKEGAIATGETDTSKTPATTASTTTTPRDLKKRITPLKITPLLLSGVSSLPSPMFPPLSATIPRPLGSSTFAFAPLDRYFFNVDQVHEWNIPSFGRVKFTDHAPLVFHAIRERFHYTLADMDEALSQPMTVMKTPGKSDAIFFASHNHGRFLLKTLRGAEPDNLKGFLSDYLGHIQKHPNTLLPRYLGMYTFEKLTGNKLATGTTGAVGTDGSGLGTAGTSFGGGSDREGSGTGGVGGAASRSKSDVTAAQHLHLNGTLLSGRDDGLPSKLVVVVLANVFDTPEVVHERYDFKGSNVGRRTLPVPVDGVAVRESWSLNPIAPELQPHVLVDKDSGWGDFAHRNPQRRTHQLATPTTGESRASSMYYEPKSDHIHSNLHSGGLGTGRTAAREGEGGAATTDISHLTLKEVDFQNRIFTGETQLIHLGSTRKAEVLAQLEEDTSLLRKHGFMDYSMLVGIRILPKRPVQNEEEEEPHICSSPESSRRGSVSSRGSDADNSNLDSDMEGGGEGSSIHDPLNSDALSRKSDSKHDIEQALGRIWKFITLSAEERLEFFKGIGEKAQEAFRDVYSFGEVIVSGGGSQGSTSPTTPTSALEAPSTRNATMARSRKDSKNTKDRALLPPEVELTAVKSDRSQHQHHHPHARKHKEREQEKKPWRPLFEDDDNENNNDIMDPDSFQTVRYKPRTDSHSSTRPKLSVLIDSTTTSRKPTLETTPRHQSMPGGLPTLPHHSAGPPTAETGAGAASRLYSSPSYQQSPFLHYGAEGLTGGNLYDPNQHPTIWSQGVPSLDLPDGYEAVYYFGLIDVLQKYNLVKWLERNIKGANVRLLGSGSGGGSSSPMTPGLPNSVPTVIHPGRSNPSTSSSFASSAFYQLLPHATSSEPSLPSPAMDVASSAISSAVAVPSAGATNATLSVLHEDPSSGRGSISSSSPTTTSSSRDPSSNRGSLLLDPNLSYSQSSVSTPISSARVSQEESTLSSASTATHMMINDDSTKTLTSLTSTSHSPSPSFSASGHQQQHKPRLSSSAPFTKSIAGARLSQYSQYSHSSQQSQHSHQSGRSRDSRLSFDIRASNASESMILPHHLSPSPSSSSPPSSDSGSGGVQIHIPPGQATQATQTHTQIHQQPPQLQHQRSKPHVQQYQAPQHAEVSVEEPGRYAERLIDFMRGVLV